MSTSCRTISENFPFADIVQLCVLVIHALQLQSNENSKVKLHLKWTKMDSEVKCMNWWGFRFQSSIALYIKWENWQNATVVIYNSYITIIWQCYGILEIKQWNSFFKKSTQQFKHFLDFFFSLDFLNFSVFELLLLFHDCKVYRVRNLFSLWR